MAIKLFTAASAPIYIEIDGKKYTAEKLTISDYHLIGAATLVDMKQAVIDRHEAEKEGSGTSKECINEYNKLSAPSPYDIFEHLLYTSDGHIIVLYTCLLKKQPEITHEWIKGMVKNDDMVQLVWDLMDVKRKLVDGTVDTVEDDDDDDKKKSN